MTHQEQLWGHVVEYLNSKNWKYETTKQNGIITLGMNLKSKLSSCRGIIIVSETEIQAITACPVKASPDVYGSVVEFLTRANYDLRIGKFEFDYSDGEIRYQCCLPCNETVPSFEDVQRCVTMGFLMFNKYGDGLVKTLMGYGDPEADIKAIRG